MFWVDELMFWVSRIGQSVDSAFVPAMPICAAAHFTVHLVFRGGWTVAFFLTYTDSELLVARIIPAAFFAACCPASFAHSLPKLAENKSHVCGKTDAYTILCVLRAQFYSLG